ncbi:aminotransferase class IV [Patescibacteria group bacterium]
MKKGQYLWKDGHFVEVLPEKIPLPVTEFPGHINIAKNYAYIPYWCQWDQYGMGVFEGIPIYITRFGPAIFKLKEHIDRLLHSAKILGMDVKYDAQQLTAAIINLVIRNRLTEDGYVRPCIGHVEERLGLVTAGGKTSYIFGVMEGSPLGNKKNLSVEIAKTIRPHPASFPLDAKISGTYVNSAISRNEAEKNERDDAIMLDWLGNVAEATTANLFLVYPDGQVVTPRSDSILRGITRETIMKLCCDMGIFISEEYVRLNDLLHAEEVFMCGSAAGIKSISEMHFTTSNLEHLIKMQVLPRTFLLWFEKEAPDNMISEKKVMPEPGAKEETGLKLVAPKISAQYFRATRGLIEKYYDWLTFVNEYWQNKK